LAYPNRVRVADVVCIAGPSIMSGQKMIE